MIKLGFPVVFRQKRVGQHEKIFEIVKFRTMTNAKDINGELLPDAERLTTFGKILRSTFLDGRAIIGQTTESFENKGFREVCPIHFHRGHDLFLYNAVYTNIESRLCQST